MADYVERAYDRLPPQDLAAEESVLGAMLLSKDAIADVVEKIKGTDFYKPAHEVIFEIILELYAKGEPADAITVVAELTRDGKLEQIGGAQYIHTLIAGVPTATNAEYYARIVKEQSVLRKLVQAGTRITQLGYSCDGSEVDAIVNEAQTEILSVTNDKSGEDYIRIGTILDSTIDDIEKNTNKKDGILGVPTGFNDLDALLGGLQAGQMIIVAARPAMGKSTLALDICRHASIRKNMTSVIFSLEMSRQEIVMRMLSAESKVFLSSLRKGNLKETDWTKIAEVTSKVSEAPLFIDDSPNMSMNEIRAKCRRLKQQENLQLIVVDYLQLMTSGKRVESRQQEVSEFSRSLKLLAKQLEIPIIAVAQLNRGPEQRQDRKPMMADLRESGSLEQDADVIMLLHRPEVFDESARPGEADIIVAKHRNGETRTISVAFQGHYARFANMAKEEA